MERSFYLDEINKAFRERPVVILLGPRGCGKKSLAVEFSGVFRKNNYFNLDDLADLARLESPTRVLGQLKGVIIIDGIQKATKAIFEAIVSVIEKGNLKSQFLLLGNGSWDLFEKPLEPLKDISTHIEIPPFSMFESDDKERLWQRGGLFGSYLAKKDKSAQKYLKDYIHDFIDRDIHNSGYKIPFEKLYKFLTVLAHYHGKVVNFSEIAQVLGVSYKTTQHYLDILSKTQMIRVVTPWVETIKKRQIKAPKVYFRDSGIVHYLMGIQSPKEFETHPKMPGSWEGFAFEQMVRFCSLNGISDFHFWSTHTGAKLDLLLFFNGERIGFEFKYCDLPKLSKSMVQARDTLGLSTLYVVYPGDEDYVLGEGICAKNLKGMLAA